MQNSAGLTKEDYKGSPSTLCTGCGHDLISNHIITACFQAGITPEQVVKFSGIGCSSKLPAYFMSKSFAFNSMHGRMAPVATGAKAVFNKMIALGISGDGDTASIGLGGYIHMLRRNLDICYIVANNGVYGLTKGQFSATADKTSLNKYGQHSPFESLDIATLSLEVGASFVARSFVGNPKEMVSVLQAAMKHKGTAVIDVISPCIAFNNHDGSSKSYIYVKGHEITMQEMNKAPFTNPLDAIREIREHYSLGKILTGIFYTNELQPTLEDTLHLPEIALRDLSESELRPNKNVFDQIMQGFQ